uniref:ANK_REP_REGION domain-containing protein n=1 Tax=Anopheles stephensi TaxID=30069 RepID=A0A182YDH7_ANOST
MNNHLAAKDNDYRSRDGKFRSHPICDTQSYRSIDRYRFLISFISDRSFHYRDTHTSTAIKPSNIRIWLHHKQMSKLAKVLWAGQGMRLRTETSHHPRMKRFLECVPHVMGVIKDIHQAVIDNDLDVLKEKTAPPAPRVILTSKDANGLTPLHKAAGLAHTQIVEYILSVWPSLSSDEDHTGKTPLHWAASAKNNARSFNLLVQAGADETALDDVSFETDRLKAPITLTNFRHKPAEHYKNKPSDIDRSLLSVIPEAPRISQQGFPAYFDWAMFTLPDDSDEVAYARFLIPTKNHKNAPVHLPIYLIRTTPTHLLGRAGLDWIPSNNLLDAETPEEGAGVADTVSKSKSVHNLTNGVLTELGRDEQQSNGVESTEEKQIEQGEVVDDKPKEENDTEQEAALSEKEDNREEATEEKVTVWL